MQVRGISHLTHAGIVLDIEKVAVGGFCQQLSKYYVCNTEASPPLETFDTLKHRYNFLIHQVPIAAGSAKAARNKKFVKYLQVHNTLSG